MRCDPIPNSQNVLGAKGMVATSPQPVGGHHRCILPLMVSRIAAGFPSPADDYVEKQIDLNTHLIQHREATFILRVSGWSMRDAGIFDGDEIIVDRAITPVDGKIVVAAINGDLTVKRLRRIGGAVHLVAENPEFPAIILQEGEELCIWGVVTRVLHRV
ncbi:translesion error-prone DNA polymerase V autoproteolytic subunit [Acidithiobacillus ferrooxidans]|uniref:LexA family protein n=1 Tax=Acidithiobacillus ferrooxidans TaxID=920 RepID=UPI00214881AB|nr:translesion error-prone DNA polymerase V autoproteolytic subunit [Acidithiobacillus ferrooxidans]MCR1347035.1 translesion error-prone DNA polymerase V autoproteolytic subunit [Acidithiobacillus ferrooxidans]MCR1355902.1 translesion error-prone DNA polymerase V autoproteolytic subunit [Acidithiobacillus ferrooxidans]